MSIRKMLPLLAVLVIGCHQDHPAKSPPADPLSAPTNCQAKQEDDSPMKVDVSWEGTGSAKGQNARIEEQQDSADNEWLLARKTTEGSPWLDDQSAAFHWTRYRVSGNEDGTNPSEPSGWTYRGNHPPDGPSPASRKPTTANNTSGKPRAKTDYYNVYSWECTSHNGITQYSSQSWSDENDPMAKAKCQADMDAHDKANHGGTPTADMKSHPVPIKP